MFYTDDPIADARRHDEERQEWLDQLPKCEHCHEAIQDDRYFYIDGLNLHHECLEAYCEENYEVFNTKLG